MRTNLTVFSSVMPEGSLGGVLVEKQVFMKGGPWFNTSRNAPIKHNSTVPRSKLLQKYNVSFASGSVAHFSSLNNAKSVKKQQQHNNNFDHLLRIND